MSVLKKEIHAVSYACRGIKQFLIKEDHGKVHLLATIVIVPTTLLLPTSATEKALLLLIIALVWGLEMLNSALEKTLDFITTERNREIAYIKDVMAGAVFIASICSIATGSIILLPKIFNYVF